MRWFFFIEMCWIFPWEKKFNRYVRRDSKLPTVLGRSEIETFFRFINGTHALMAKMLFGSGLRLMECVRLRIKDVDFDRKRIHILGKGDKWRSTILPESIISELYSHIEKVKLLHRRDRDEGFGEVYIPPARLFGCCRS